MNIKLRPAVEDYVKRRVKRGDYRSANELVDTALTILQTSEATDPGNVARLKREVAVGLARLDRGESVDFTAKAIMKEGRRILAARKKARA